MDFILNIYFGVVRCGRFGGLVMIVMLFVRLFSLCLVNCRLHFSTGGRRRSCTFLLGDVDHPALFHGQHQRLPFSRSTAGSPFHHALFRWAIFFGVRFWELAFSKKQPLNMSSTQQYHYFPLRLPRWSHFVSGQQEPVRVQLL